MAAGTARHAELEAEVLERVEIEVTTQEDKWALRALNVHAGLTQLRQTGMTRELPVFGWLLDQNDDDGSTGYTMGKQYDDDDDNIVIYRGEDADEADRRGGEEKVDGIVVDEEGNGDGREDQDEEKRATNVDFVEDVGGAFAVGIIDELWLGTGGASGAGVAVVESGRGTTATATTTEASARRVRIVDHKTRVKPTLPTEAQARTTRLQLMAYKALYDGMVTRGLAQEDDDSPGVSGEDEGEGDGGQRDEEGTLLLYKGRQRRRRQRRGRSVYRRLGLDPGRQLSDEIAAHALDLGVVVDKKEGEDTMEASDGNGGGGETEVGVSRPPLTLGDVFVAVSRAAKLLPASSDTLFVEYEWQRDGSVIGHSAIEHDADWLKRRVRRHLAFWDGTRESKDGEGAAASAPPRVTTEENVKDGVYGVCDDEAWKCERCRFSGDCPTAAVFAERWRAAHPPVSHSR